MSFITIDLNIDNYSIGELKKFFKLSKNYKNEELNKKITEMTTIINSLPDIDYKHQETLDFINQSKQILIKKEENNPDTKIQDNNNEYDNITQIPLKNPLPNPNSNIGQIIDLNSNHYPMETTYIENDSPLKYDKFIKNYVINTRYRDDYFGTFSNNCTFTFPGIIKNVISMSLSALQYQNVMFSISNSNHTDQIYIHEDTTNNEGVVIMPEGNYSYLDFPSIMATAINEQIIGSGGPNRFSVSINPNTHFVTISNSTYTFTMEIITLFPRQFGVNCDYEFTFKAGENDPKNNPKPEQMYNSLGYMMGYRKTVYSNKMSYQSESIYQSERYKYVYFIVNDYVGNQTQNTAGIFPKSMLDQDILALIPISSEVFTTTFSDGSTYIYRTRNYNGPVDIRKISIQLINPMGQLADIHETDFTFCLQIETISDMSKKFIYKS
jgi:hypothetical protein